MNASISSLPNMSYKICHTLWKDLEQVSKVQIQVFVLINFVISFVTVLTNVLVTAAIIKLKRYRRPSHLLLMALSCSDFTVGLVSNSSVTYMLLRLRNRSPCQIKVVLLSCFFIPISFSVLFTFLVTTERIIHMRFLDRYSDYVTRRRTTIAILTTGIFATIGAFLVVFKVANNMFSVVFNVLIVGDILMMISLTICFIHTYREILRKIRNRKSITQLK